MEFPRNHLFRLAAISWAIGGGGARPAISAACAQAEDARLATARMDVARILVPCCLIWRFFYIDLRVVCAIALFFNARVALRCAPDPLRTPKGFLETHQSSVVTHPAILTVDPDRWSPSGGSSDART
ncbi:unnamed protein product [Pieris brassicae]|uniref:Uncharacterized protein n=1 Tax=Pieris brassicae TaxID=7116 RepID=A0A9P0TJP5_PIEBR|nr:unnamed protein product [Pieris brassicae]